MPKLTPETLEKLALEKSAPSALIRVGMSTCGLAAGAGKVYDTLLAEAKKLGISVEVSKCGCLGMCHAEPLVEVIVEGMPSVVYGRVTPDAAAKILQLHVMKKVVLDDHIVEHG